MHCLCLRVCLRLPAVQLASANLLSAALPDPCGHGLAFCRCEQATCPLGVAHCLLSMHVKSQLSLPCMDELPLELPGQEMGRNMPTCCLLCCFVTAFCNVGGRVPEVPIESLPQQQVLMLSS